MLAEASTTNFTVILPHDRTELDASIPHFLHHRLGIQLLCEHYMEICKHKPHGTIDYERQVAHAALDAAGEANILAQAYSAVVPEIVFLQDDNRNNNNNNNNSLSPPITATFVGPWLHYVLTEVLKNAVTATVHHHRHHHPDNNEPNDNVLPPIIISTWQDDATTWIAVDDHGPGLGPSKSQVDDSLFRFAQTDKIWDRLDEQTTYAMVERSPLQGLGVGLSLSATMMQYFGGTLMLQNRSDGGGARACLGLPRDLTIPEASSSLLSLDEKEQEDESR